MGPKLVVSFPFLCVPCQRATDEGHGLVRPPNVLDMYLRIEKFLAKTLGGVYLLADTKAKAFQGTSARIE